MVEGSRDNFSLLYYHELMDTLLKFMLDDNS